jgi:hypothetical protein
VVLEVRGFSMRALIWEDWINIIIQAAKQEDRSKWLRGDVISRIESEFKVNTQLSGRPGRWGRDVIDLIAWSTGESRWQLDMYKKVASAFPEEFRDLGLRWEHYRIAAQSDEPKRWIKCAISEGLSVSQLRRRMDEEKALKDIETGYLCNVCNSSVKQKDGIFCRYGGVLVIFCSSRCLVKYFSRFEEEE